ncbi:MAG: hypothetical protein JWQ71_2641 [Pedosphaera sp.]|nr:hypothetical protein [Pedosphaera sp.]
MLSIKKLLAFLLLPLLIAGCSTTPAAFTNLTPQDQFRNPNGLYPVEAAFSSRQQTLRWDSMRPTVMVGTDFYPMRPTPLMKNRYETLIPVPAGAKTAYYRFKFDYDYTGFGKAETNSTLSPVYQMRILDK